MKSLNNLIYSEKDRAKEYKKKILQDSLLQRESVMRLPKDTALKQMDWPKD